MLPSGMQHMGLVWGSVNRLMYCTLACFLRKYIKKRYPDQKYKIDIGVTVLGDDGSLNISVTPSDGSDKNELSGKLVPNYVIRNFWKRKFRFTVDEFNWSRRGIAAEDQSDFLKEVIIKGDTYWKPSALLKTLNTTQRCYFRRLQQFTKMSKSNSPRTKEYTEGRYYNSFEHWLAIASSGINLSIDLDWFVPYGAYLMQYTKNCGLTFKYCYDYCMSKVVKGRDDVLNKPRGLSGFRAYIKMYGKKRSTSTYINLGQLEHELMCDGTDMPLTLTALLNGDYGDSQLALRYAEAHGLSPGSVRLLPDMRRIRNSANNKFRGQSNDAEFCRLYSLGCFEIRTVAVPDSRSCSDADL